MKPYIVQGAEQVYQQPFICENALFYGFILPADKTCLQKNVCDRLFNDPMRQPGRFVPAGPFVLMVFCSLDKLVSEPDPYRQWGAFAEQEVAFWVATVDTVNDQVYFVFPYIWVDNAYALSMGREIYGFPKQLGRFEIPKDHGQAGYFQLESLALNPLNPNTMGEWLKVVEVKKTGATAGFVKEWNGFADAVEDTAKMVGALHDWRSEIKLIEHLFGDLIHGTVPFAFLKQFRDVADGSLACYQAVIETNCKCTAWHGGGLLDGAYEVDIEEIGSMPISQDLGLTPGPIQPSISFWCSFDFFIGNGQEIWKA